MAGQRMFDGDALMRQLGAKLLSIGDATAELSLPATDSMVQAHGTCHGGAIFAMADAAFGVACNTSRPWLGEHEATLGARFLPFREPTTKGAHKCRAG